MDYFKAKLEEAITKRNFALIVLLLCIFVIWGPIWTAVIGLVWSANELSK